MDIFYLPQFVAVDATGAPLPGAKLYFYAATTSTPEDTYTTSARNIAHSNPVVADSEGRFPAIYFGTTNNYKAILKKADDTTVFTEDNIANATVLGSLIAAGTVPTAALADNAVTLAKQAHGTQGGLMIYGASGAPTELSYGNAGEVLVAGGMGVNAAFGTVPLYAGQTIGLTVSLNSSDSDHDIDIAAGAARDSTDTVNIVCAADTVQCDVLFGTGDGILSSGSLASNTDYYLFAISKTDGTQKYFLYTTTDPTGNLPTGYTYFAILNGGDAVMTDASANLIDAFHRVYDATATASGTAVDFRIPAWAKRVTVVCRGLVRDETTYVYVQLVGGSGVKSSGYSGAGFRLQDSTQDVIALGGGFAITSAVDGVGASFHGKAYLDLVGTAIWSLSGGTARSGGDAFFSCHGDADLGEQLTTIRITTLSGTATLSGLLSVSVE